MPFSPFSVEPGASDRAAPVHHGTRAQLLRRRFPTILNMRDAARKNLPRFAFEYLDGGAGQDSGIARNWRALDAIEILPRYGVTTQLPCIDITLFGRRYAAPTGVAPMGSPSLGFPGADRHLAGAAQRIGLPYTLSAVGGLTIEEAGKIAPDVLWFQLPRLSLDNHKLGFDLMRRAMEAGVHVLMLTMDTPIRTTRPREVQSGITSPFRPDFRMIASILTSPAWFFAMRKYGVPRFANFRSYAPNANLAEMTEFVRNASSGAFTWDEVAMYRERWKGPLLLKGIMHPDDAERAIALGCDGLVVSTHGGRQLDLLPAPIDALPAIVAQVRKRATVLMDSGVRSGSDIVRAVALGAEAAFAGKAFMWSLGALGAGGPLHAMELLIEETKAALGQIGAHSVEAARTAEIRHPDAYPIVSVQDRNERPPTASLPLAGGGAK